MVADAGGVKVGITHGDEKLIGGWDRSRDPLQDPLRQDEISQFMARNGIGVFATTHTFAALGIELEHGPMINNGAAGMPNFEGQHECLTILLLLTNVKGATMKITDARTYGEMVRKRRKELDYTQQDLADYCGCSTVYVSRLEF